MNPNVPHKPDVLVIGAGAAGLFAALGAAREGAQVLVLEKTGRVGTKILISGGGKCNIAHAGELEDVIRAFDKAEALFLRPSCYGLRNSEIMEFFESRRLALYSREDGRVFPVDGTARDVVNILLGEVLDLGVNLCLYTPVVQIVVQERDVIGVEVTVERSPHPSHREAAGGSFGAKALLNAVLARTSEGGQAWQGPPFIPAKRVILTCGGSSYPASGTTGDGWDWAQELGHTIVRPRAALAPIYLFKPLSHLSGVAIPACKLVARVGAKKAAEGKGDLLLTHQGISGPACLRASRSVALLMEVGAVSLEVDLLPDVSVEHVGTALAKAATRNPSLTVLQWLQTLAPHRIASEIASQSPVSAQLAISTLGRKNQMRLAELAKGWQLGQAKSVPIEKGEVTAGGIALDEVDPKTMRSHKISGLYIAGEVLDIAGPVGGYNLQAAFATGYRAGQTAARDALANP